MSLDRPHQMSREWKRQWCWRTWLHQTLNFTIRIALQSVHSHSCHFSPSSHPALNTHLQVPPSYLEYTDKAEPTWSSVRITYFGVVPGIRREEQADGGRRNVHIQVFKWGHHCGTWRVEPDSSGGGFIYHLLFSTG